MAREEPHVVAALVTLCNEMGIKRVLQVGAEDGYEAWCIKQAIGDACRAVAIDADPQCEPHQDAEWHKALIGAKDSAKAPFYLYAKGLSSQLKRGGDDTPVTMPMMRLDTFCRWNSVVPDALIIDTEGTTLDVLEGATGILAGVRLIYAECSDGQIRPGGNSDIKDVRAFLSAHGFVERAGIPAYDPGGQGNFCWVRPRTNLRVSTKR